MTDAYAAGAAAASPLLRLSQALLGETDVQVMLNLAAHSAAETLGAEFAAVVLLDAAASR